MRKIIMVILAGAMFFTLLAGCDGGEKGSSADEGKTQENLAEEKLSEFKRRAVPQVETIAETEPLTTMNMEEFFDKIEIKEHPTRPDRE